MASGTCFSEGTPGIRSNKTERKESHGSVREPLSSSGGNAKITGRD